MGRYRRVGVRDALQIDVIPPQCTRLLSPERPPGDSRAPTRRDANLRHSKIAVTMEIYTEVPSAATRDALRKLSDWLARSLLHLLLRQGQRPVPGIGTGL